jgi:hypothetical protein
MAWANWTDQQKEAMLLAMEALKKQIPQDVSITDGQLCPNCGHPATQRYCSVCGQKLSWKKTSIEYHGPRHQVVQFAKAMEVELLENDYKGGWKDCNSSFLLEKLDEEVAELKEVVKLCRFTEGNSGEKKPNLELRRNVSSEAADVGNIAMMLADICDAL